MTVSVDAPVAPAATASPSGELARRIARVRSQAAAGGYDRGLLIVGGVLLPLGVLVIFLGWLGASQTVLLFEQIPYLVSGGFLGLALVVVGGFVYFTYWQTLSVREARTANRELIATLHRLEAVLAGGGGNFAGAPSATATSPAAAGGALVATPTGTMAHRPDCTVVAGRRDLRRVDPSEGLEACKLCQPDVG